MELGKRGGFNQMDSLRNLFDDFYDLIKPIVFKTTEKNPKIAHSLFVNFCWVLHNTGLERLVLDCEENKKQLPFTISTAGGFDRNGEIPPSALKYLGFDRMVIGTVTNDSWKGNPEPNIIRYPETETLINWVGWSGVGAERVVKNIQKYENCRISTTINFGPTPNKSGNELTQDLKETILKTRDLSYVDRFELDISCPNLHSSCGTLDARREHQTQLPRMLEITCGNVHPAQEAYVKISPDINEEEVDETLKVCEEYPIAGFTISNTTTKHNLNYIPLPPGKGGASGNAVYDDSLRVQKLFSERVPNHIKIAACGGINSVERVRERVSVGNVTEIQILTPLVFSGPKLLRKIRREY
jgi:dihydroorotate dehydrogenase